MSFKRFYISCALICLFCLQLPAAPFTPDPGVALSLFNAGKYQEAAALLEAAHKQGKAGYQEEVLLAVCYIKLEQLPAARQLLDTLAKRKPNDGFLHFAYANLEFAAANFQAAYTHFKQAGEQGYDRTGSLAGMTAAQVNLGVLYFKEGNHKAARDAFLQAYKIDKTSFTVLKNLGLLEMKTENYTQAAFYLEQALVQVPENEEIITLLLTIYKKSDNQDAVLNNLLRLITVQPYNGDLHAAAGRIYEQKGNRKAALESFALAEEYGTEEPYVYYRLAALITGNREERLYLVHQAIGKAIYRISIIRMEAAGKIKQTELTAEEVQEIKALSRQAEEPNNLLEQSLQLLKSLFRDPGELEADIEQLLDWYPAGTELKVALGKLYNETRQWEKAESLWGSVLKKHPALYAAQQGMGYCLEMTGRLQNAAVFYLRALDLAPGTAELYTDLERLYGKSDALLELAVQLTNRSLRDKRNPLLFEALIRLEEKLGMKAEAAIHRQRLKEIED